jgi:carbon monoxide dehydrogenase subunit G
MKVQGERTFAAPRETVFEVLNDPKRMAALMPGVESFEVDDERHWRANVKIPLGLGGLRLTFKFEKLEERRPEFARLQAKGEGVGALVSMDTNFALGEEDGGTSMRWEADVRIAGPVGSMGQRVLQPIVNQQVQAVLGALDKQVTEAKGAAASASGNPGEKNEPELEDAGPPAEPTPDADAGSEMEGSSGAEEGVSPWDEEAYGGEPPEPPRR